MRLETTLNQVLARIFTLETRQVSIDGNFALDYASLVKLAVFEALLKVCDGLRGDAFVAAQEVG